MLDKKQEKRISKRLSLHLRHDPEGLGLALEPGGWVDVDKLLMAFSKKYFPLTFDELKQVIQNNDKQRYGSDETGLKIRAHRGHSTDVDLQLEPKTPPDVLYHGTARHTLQVILKDGLKSMKRQHVHLSTDKETMMAVATRHGKPVLLRVDAQDMVEQGHTFYQSTNGIWLSNFVPSDYISVAS